MRHTQNTNKDIVEYDKTIKKCRTLFVERNTKYGDSWKILDFHSTIYLVLMKLTRIKNAIFPKTIDEIEDSINYLVMAHMKYKEKECK